MNKSFSVKIKLDNAAFDFDPRPELRRILLDLTDRLHNSADAYILQDSNGNSVGVAGFRRTR